MDDVVGKDFVVSGRQCRIGADLVVDPKENSYGEECQHDRDICKSTHNETETAFIDILRCEHALHHVLVGAMGCHGEECRTENRGKNSVGILQHLPERFAKGFGRLPPGLKHRDFASVEHLMHFAQTAGDAVKDGKNGKNHGAAHEAGLDEISPHNGLDAPDGRVGGCDGCNKNDTPEIGPDRDLHIWKKISPDDDQNDSAQVESHTDSEHAAEEEYPTRHVFRARAESNCEVFINALDLELKIRSQEKIGDNDAGQNRSDGELGVGEAECFVTLGRCAQKCRRACLGGDDRGQNGPPWDFVSPEGEFLQGIVPTPGVEADAYDQDEINENDKAVDEKGSSGGHGRRFFTSTTEFLPLASYFWSRSGGRREGSAAMNPPFC